MNSTTKTATAIGGLLVAVVTMSACAASPSLSNNGGQAPVADTSAPAAPTSKAPAPKATPTKPAAPKPAVTPGYHLDGWAVVGAPKFKVSYGMVEGTMRVKNTHTSVGDAIFTVTFADQTTAVGAATGVAPGATNTVSLIGDSAVKVQKVIDIQVEIQS